MSLALLFAPLIAQASLNPSLNSSLDPTSPGFGVPAIETAPIPASPARNRLDNCLAKANAAPDDALDAAHDWLKDAGQAQERAQERALPQMCLGVAYAGLERWVDAEAAFVAGRDAAAPDDRKLRARLGIMAGNAALAGGSPVSALTELDAARQEAAAAGITAWLVDIAIDRARALVLLKRPDDAAAALAEARAAAPNDAQAWLLSATLARRMNRLAEAQQDIETAARLAPAEPDIGLEAGVIAELSGHEDVARKEWQSVVAADPSGAMGRQAAAYLGEIGPGHADGPPASDAAR